MTAASVKVLTPEELSRTHASALARGILATYEVPPLPDEVLRELAALEVAADRELLGERASRRHDPRRRAKPICPGTTNHQFR